MIDCTLLSDRMIAVAHGRAVWTAEDRAHLAACPDCSGEWSLVQRGARLGIAVGQELPAELLATRVLAELRKPAPARFPRLRTWRWVALPIAAALAVMVWRGQPPAPEPAAGVTVASSQGLLPELEGLESSDLESLLDVLPATESPVGDARGLGDLDEDELQTMLRSLEG